ncbi:MAG: CRISPR-associated helicase Cas3' [Blastocatellia bacterium]|nr:CRISPR-associated helicase Cas3' [Blastocatellia bacterium]
MSNNNSLPISDFLRLIPGFENHTEFSLESDTRLQEQVLNCSLAMIQPKKRAIDIFLETQFGFACLLEADKRDAGDNEIYKRQELKDYFKSNFVLRLSKTLNKIELEAEQNNLNSELNQVRTKMRKDAIKNLQHALNSGDRVFTLSAPTGAGKTLMLLSLAQEILSRQPHLSIIYSLPFLSITEQVEEICKNIFNDFQDFEAGKFKDDTPVLRIDSRSENKNIERLQKELESDQREEILAELLRENFSSETFDHPFIITTFVQLFETMVSNRNAALLRLPNFSRTLILLDEIQALPPRLYTFFVALLDEFCRHFDSYAIVSTATMPYLEIVTKDHLKNRLDCQKPENLFTSYKRPTELLSNSYYEKEVFNRYCITREEDISNIEELAQKIRHRNQTCLVILNTIDDTKQLYNRLGSFYSSDEIILLNTHFTLNDRRKKLAYCQQRLKNRELVILISTQLIEAGVDIDFPVLYRDLCPLPNLIQSSGRCNRNGNLKTGNVYLIAVRNPDSGHLSANFIYRGKDKILLDFSKDSIPSTLTELEVKGLQEKYFKFIGDSLTIGEHQQYQETLYMVEHISRMEFDTIGKFKLIDEKDFGEEYRYFIPQGFNDYRFEQLSLLANTKSSRDFASMKNRRIAIENHLRLMSADIVQFRLTKGRHTPQCSAEIMGIHKLADAESYSFEIGILLETGGCFI